MNVASAVVRVAGAVLLFAGAAQAQFFAPSPNLPPLGSSYLGQFHSYPGAGILLNNPIHSQFTNSTPPPLIFGGFVIDTFGSLTEGDLFFNGNPAGHVTAPGNTSVRVQNTGQSGPTMFFDTEMLQLDIAGGTLPPGVLIRESPTRASIGQTSITNVGGGMFRIDSFFDVFTELSLDGGQTWNPSNGSTRMTISPAPGVLGLLGVAGLVAARRRRM